MEEIILAGIAAACLLAWLHYGTQYHPPGEGYAEERRTGRLSTIFGVLGLAFIAGSIAASIT